MSKSKQGQKPKPQAKPPARKPLNTGRQPDRPSVPAPNGRGTERRSLTGVATK